MDVGSGGGEGTASGAGDGPGVGPDGPGVQLAISTIASTSKITIPFIFMPNVQNMSTGIISHPFVAAQVVVATMYLDRWGLKIPLEEYKRLPEPFTGMF